MNEKIRVDEMTEGIRQSKKNAERLLQDSKVLFDKGRHTSSFLLSQLCMEEQAKAFRLIRKQLRRKDFPREEWKQFAYFHDEKLKYIQKVNDEIDAEMVKGSIGTDYWVALKQMYPYQGEKWLEHYRDSVAKDLLKFRHTKLYTDYDFKKRKWINANQVDLVFSLRSRFMAERLLQYLDLMIAKMERC